MFDKGRHETILANMVTICFGEHIIHCSSRLPANFGQQHRTAQSHTVDYPRLSHRPLRRADQPLSVPTRRPPIHWTDDPDARNRSAMPLRHYLRHSQARASRKHHCLHRDCHLDSVGPWRGYGMDMINVSNKAFHPYGAQSAPRVNADVG